MSPVDPISPISPISWMSISPTSSSGDVEKSLNMPVTPVIPPAVHLPRLLTSFPTGNRVIENVAVQFELPTPSPLSLGQTPVTVAIRGDLLQYQAMDETDDMLLDHDATSATFVDSTISRRAVKDLQTTSTTATLSSSSRRLSRSPISKSNPKTSKQSINHHHRRRHNLSIRTHKLPNTPKLHIVVPPTPRTKQRRAETTHILKHLAFRLVPLVSVTTGEPHPGFPTSLLQFHLLTHDQLDDLARWYHQTVDAGIERWSYPCPLAEGKVWCSTVSGGQVVAEVDLDTKRRRWGRFIGLRGCDSPVVVQEQQQQVDQSTGEDESDVDITMEETTAETAQEMRTRLDREWREALRRAREQDLSRDKSWRGRF